MYIADLKNKKASLETSVERAQRDVDKLAEPQVGDIKLTKRFGQLGIELFLSSVVNTADWFRLGQKRRAFYCPPIAAHAAIQTTNQISKPTRVADTKRRKSHVDKLRIGTEAPLPPPFGGDFRMEVMGVLTKETN